MNSAVVTLPHERSRVWRALTSRTDLCGWLGDVQHGLAGPGDRTVVAPAPDYSFAVVVTTWDPPQALGLEWSFLGVSPPSAVRWELAPAETGATRAVVVEWDPAAGPADVALQRALWEARLLQLRAYLDGVPDARRAGLLDIRLATTVPTTTVPLLHHRHVHRWLPVAGIGTPARHFFVVDSDGPRRFRIERWDTHFDERLVLRIEVAPHEPVTTAQVTVTATGTRPSLAVEHTGWRQLGLQPERVVELRARFHAAWRQALTDAQEVQPTRGSAR